LSFSGNPIYEDYITIRVSDTGVGIDENSLFRIFDPFYTTKPKDRGTGLGLSMVYNIVKQHNGFISVQSKVSVGTTITVFIPYAKSKAEFQIASTAKTEIKENHGTILLVDDDSAVQIICSDLLKMLGFSVIITSNGRQCIEIYAEKKKDIDIVILDVMMPVMSGDETFLELLKINPQIKVIVSSGFREDPRISKMMVLGAKAFLQKPYTIEKLANALSRI
jgi:CheY-like chemotaxis protein